MKKYIALLVLCAPLSTSLAWQWQDLWSRPDQQAAKLLANTKADQAAKRFVNPQWKAVAQYRSGSYKDAAFGFNKENTADGFYNKGNALAHMGKYKESIAAYDQAIKLQTDPQDAKYNRELIAKLLKDKKQQQGSDKQQDQEKDKQDQQQQDQQQKQASNKQQDDKNKQRQNEPQDQQQKKQEQQDQQNKQDQQQNKKQEQQNQQDKNKPKEQQQKQSEQKQQHSQAEQQPEQQKADEQMLNRIPDDPGGLLRQKFLRDHYRRKQGKQT